MKPEIGQEEDTEMLDASETKRFRSLAATLDYTSSDRSDVQYAAKEVCTKMANPTRGCWKRFKKGRQILERSRESDIEDGSMAKQRGVDCGRACGFELGHWAREEVHEWRNDDDQRHGREHWSRTQATRALSTAEAEYYSVVTGAAEGLGMQSMMADLGVTTQVRIWTDSNAAKAIASRRGLGKTVHVELRYLWLQEMTKSGRVKMRRIPGEQNLADHLTKEKAWHQIEMLI